jgi:phage baseplate assembly protein W
MSDPHTIQVAFPYRLTRLGREAHVGRDQHIRDMIEQILFTNPGERVNRPDFGCGLLTLTFAGLGDQLDATTQSMVMGSLQHWLGGLIRIEAVSVQRDQSELEVTVQYVVRAGQERVVVRFTR